MNIKIGKGALSGLLAFLVLVAAYWYWSPHLAIHQMQTAAKAADADAFNDKVDYPKLRESLKGQFSAALAEKMGSSTDSSNPFAALGGMLGLAMVDKMVDAMVRPETVNLGRIKESLPGIQAQVRKHQSTRTKSPIGLMNVRTQTNSWPMQRKVQRLAISELDLYLKEAVSQIGS